MALDETRKQSAARLEAPPKCHKAVCKLRVGRSGNLFPKSSVFSVGGKLHVAERGRIEVGVADHIAHCTVHSCEL